MDIQDKLKAFNKLKKVIMENNVLSLIRSNDFGVRFKPGYTIEPIDTNHFADIDPNEVFYYYDGPLDEKTRAFCEEILIIGKFFRQSDIDKLSTKAGYDVDLYMGSYNCRHKWVRARIKGQIQNGYVPETVNGNEINKIGRRSIDKIN